MTDPYDDIINLPRHVSTTRPRMPMQARAAQFAPFAALTGHDAAIAETARTTSPHIEPSADRQQTLSRKIALTLSAADSPQISITYFRPDNRKIGGEYVTVRGSVKKVEEYLNHLILSDRTEIPLDCITDISSTIEKLS